MEKLYFYVLSLIYNLTTDGSTPVGTIIARVEATDRDNPPFNTLRYQMTGDGSAPTFFEVDAVGNIKVRSSLSADLSTRYNLRVLVSDSGQPAKTSTATGVVFLVKNRYC